MTRAAYEAAALSVTGVVDVHVADRHPRGEGTVDVVVMGTAGMPTASLLAAVEGALADAIVINHDLLVKAPVAVGVHVKAVLELLSGDETSILAEAESWVRSLFSYDDDEDVPRFSIGKDVVRDRIASGIVGIPGVKRIRWENPAEDIEIPADGLAVLVSLELSAVWVNEA